MQREELKLAVQNMKVWQRGGQRAPHKPPLPSRDGLLKCHQAGRPNDMSISFGYATQNI